MVRSVSSTESSAPIVTGLPSASSDTAVEGGALPSAMHLTTMSRSVNMPLSRLSSPQMGIAPTSRSRSLRAASLRVSLTETHSALPVMISRAVAISPPQCLTHRYPAVTAANRLGRFDPEVLGLNQMSRMTDLHHSDGRPVPVLYAYSPAVVPVPSGYPRHTHVTGYWAADGQHTLQPPTELVDLIYVG